MDLKKSFEESQETVKNLNKRPSNDELLKLYALYKQATSGDAFGKRPSLINVKERAKWDAWKVLEGKKSEEAMEAYTDVVNTLINSYGTKS